MKTIALTAALLAAASTQAGVLDHALFVEDVREKMPPLVIPHLEPTDAKPETIIDSDPRSRQTVLDFVTNHAALEWSRLKLTHRQHILFDRGQSQITDADRAALKALAEAWQPDDTIVILGFTDQEGDNAINQELAQKRSESLSEALSHWLPAHQTIVINSIHWPGDPVHGRRAEAIILNR